jgi:hypothetical protein
MTKGRILIVGSDMVLLLMLRDPLSACGYSLLPICRDPLSARVIFWNLPVDAALIDAALKADVTSLLADLRGGHVPFAFVTRSTGGWLALVSRLLAQRRSAVATHANELAG